MILEPRSLPEASPRFAPSPFSSISNCHSPLSVVQFSRKASGRGCSGRGTVASPRGVNHGTTPGLATTPTPRGELATMRLVKSNSAPVKKQFGFNFFIKFSVHGQKHKPAIVHESAPPPGGNTATNQKPETHPPP